MRLATSCPEASPAWGPAPVVAVPAAMTSGQQPEHAVVEPEEGRGTSRSAEPGLVVRGSPVHQDDGVDQEEHGGEEVHHDQVRVELGVDDDPAQHGLGQDPGHQATAQPDQVAPPGPPEDRAQEGGRHRDGR